jgi:hypothetical protein
VERRKRRRVEESGELLTCQLHVRRPRCTCVNKQVSTTRILDLDLSIHPLRSSSSTASVLVMPGKKAAAVKPQFEAVGSSPSGSPRSLSSDDAMCAALAGHSFLEPGPDTRRDQY